MDKHSDWVAVVDDDEPIRRALLRLLRSAGIKARAFSSGITFLDSLQVCQPYCVVLDIQMPRMSGLEVQARLTLEAPDMSVILVTGQHSPEAQAYAMRTSSRFYLLKPMNDQLLLHAIALAARRDAVRHLHDADN